MPAGTRAGGAIPGPALEPEQTAADGALNGDAHTAGPLAIEPARSASETTRALTLKTTACAARWLRLRA